MKRSKRRHVVKRADDGATVQKSRYAKKLRLKRTLRTPRPGWVWWFA